MNFLKRAVSPCLTVDNFTGQNSSYGLLMINVATDSQIDVWFSRRYGKVFSIAEPIIDEVDDYLLNHEDFKSSSVANLAFNFEISHYIDNPNFKWSKKVQEDIIDKYANDTNKKRYRIKRIKAIFNAVC